MNARDAARYALLGLTVLLIATIPAGCPGTSSFSGSSGSEDTSETSDTGGTSDSGGTDGTSGTGDTESPPAAPAATVDLAATGQTTSYVANDDGDAQSGESMPASSRFVDNGDGTITDQLTGLMWLQDAACLYTQYPTWETDGWADGWVPWSDALEFISDINGGTLSACGAGYTDWRLPNVLELESLVDAGEGKINLWLMSVGFLRVEANDYWTSTTYAHSPDVFAYTVEFDAGSVSALGTKNSVITSVWPVRGATSGSTTELWVTGQTTTHVADDDGDRQKGVAWPSPRFTDNGDGTVTDNLTGLMWLQDMDTIGIRAWPAAIAAAAQFSADPASFGAENYTASYTDWRVPNRKELLSLADFSQSHPALQDGHPLLNVCVTAPYWTSTTCAGTPQRAWLGDLRTGELSTELKANGYRTILVR